MLDTRYSELDLGSSSVGGWRQIEKRMSNNEYRISNVEERNSIDFLKDKAEMLTRNDGEDRGKPYDFEKRLVDFAIRIIRMAEFLLKAKLAYHNDWMSGPN